MKESNEVTTIQLTAKRFKLHKIFSWVFILLGLLLMSLSSNDTEKGDMVIGALLSLGGFIFLGITRARIWWNHK